VYKALGRRMLLGEISVHGTAWDLGQFMYKEQPGTMDCEPAFLQLLPQLKPSVHGPRRGNFGPWHSSTFATHHPFFVWARTWFTM
jgi:hypothetical protein